MISPFEIILLVRLKEKIANASTQNEIYEAVTAIEQQLGFIKCTLYDNPFFLVSPGTEKKKEEWLSLLKTYGSPNVEEIEKLLYHGFVIFERNLMVEKTLVDIFEPFGFENNELLLDKDYGLVILPEKSIQKKNFYLGMSELSRYQAKYPHLQRNLSDIFSLGALRIHAILGKKMDFLPIEILIDSKEKLLNIVQEIQQQLKKFNSRFQIWFRGQPNEYFLDKMEEELVKHCPWRQFQDVSLVPSLFRKTEFLQNDFKTYANRLCEILNYELALKIHLDVPQYELRKNIVEEYKEYFKGTVWEDSNSPMYTTVTDGEGNIKEIHDYNPIYRALQTSLFLQHYGIPTNILDITKDIDVAIYFAQHKIVNGKYVPVEDVGASVIYLFLLDPQTDRFLDSTELLETFHVPRPLRQKCGVLAGASYSYQNYYSKFISIRFKLTKRLELDNRVSTEFLFPTVEEDDILSFLTSHSKHQKLNQVTPL